MPLAKLNSNAVVANAPPTAISQPERGSLRRRRLASTIARPPTAAKPSSQPACPPSAELSSRSGPGEPPKKLPPGPPGPPDCPSTRPRPL